MLKNIVCVCEKMFKNILFLFIQMLKFETGFVKYSVYA